MNDGFELLYDTPCSMTLDCIDFWLDGPGDHTVRPCRPEHLEHAKAERAKILAAQALQNHAPPQGEKQA
jgi:hypothetical protein